jgi:hypothetical protein
VARFATFGGGQYINAPRRTNRNGTNFGKFGQKQQGRREYVQERRRIAMKRKRKYIWAYLDGEKLVEVIQAALDSNKSVDDVKKLLVAENPGHNVSFKVLEY